MNLMGNRALKNLFLFLLFITLFLTLTKITELNKSLKNKYNLNINLLNPFYDSYNPLNLNYSQQVYNLSKVKYVELNNISNFSSISLNSSNLTDYLVNITLAKCDYTIENKSDYKNNINKQELSFDQIKNNLDTYSIKLVNGGKSYTHLNSKCDSSYAKYKKIAVIIPYRDRLPNLKFFLNNIHFIMNKQKVNYGIYLVEPNKTNKFNRGLLMNIGFIEAIKDGLNLKEDFEQVKSGFNLNDSYWDCFVFHDADMIPEDERLLYTCSDNTPLHFAVAVSKFGYSVDGYFRVYFGGITSFTREQYASINGFSNLYFGWGAEDDDLYARAVLKYGSIKKMPKEIARIYTHEHTQDKANPDRFQILDKQINDMRAKKQIKEGLTTIQYKVESIERNYLFTRVFVNYDQTYYDDMRKKFK